MSDFIKVYWNISLIPFIISLLFVGISLLLYRKKVPLNKDERRIIFYGGILYIIFFMELFGTIALIRVWYIDLDEKETPLFNITLNSQTCDLYNGKIPASCCGLITVFGLIYLTK